MAQIMIVGEAWGADEEAAGAPFVGYSGQILDKILHQVGIVRDECWLTNVFNFRPTDNKLKYLSVNSKEEALVGYPKIGKFWIGRKYQKEIDRLFEEIKFCNPTLIITLGGTALWALTKQSQIKRYRGSPIWSFLAEKKILPTYHPSAIGRQWGLLPIVISDMQKARREAEFPQIRRPRRLIYLYPTIEDIESFYHKFIKDAPDVSCDIETKGTMITEVGFAPRPDRALVIPFLSRKEKDGNYWRTALEERLAWGWVRRICTEFPLVGQNFSYDIQYFWRQMNIPCPTIADDTMIMHHSLEPEMEKSLGFLGSIYTDEPAWKFMRTDHSTLKRED